MQSELDVDPLFRGPDVRREEALEEFCSKTVAEIERTTSMTGGRMELLVQTTMQRQVAP